MLAKHEVRPGQGGGGLGRGASAAALVRSRGERGERYKEVQFQYFHKIRCACNLTVFVDKKRSQLWR
jgi:hypothetical protein